VGKIVGQIAKVPEVKQSNSNSRVRRTERLQSMDTPVDRILFLQRTAGNQAVSRLISSGALQAMRLSSSPQVILQRKRGADIFHKGHYSFYLKAGGSREFAVQFYYSSTGHDVTIKIAHQKTGTMIAGTYSFPSGKTFNPSIIKDGTITVFDMDGDDKGDISVLVRIDDHITEYLTKPKSGSFPTIQQYLLRDAYMVATWPGGHLMLESPQQRPPEAITPPLWVMKSHPRFGRVYFNTTSKEYIALPPFPYSLSSTSKGPPAFFKQQPTLKALRGSYSPKARGTEGVADPFRKTGTAASGLTEAHEALRGIAPIPHRKVPSWGAFDVARWKRLEGEKYLFEYKDKWVKGYRKIIRAAADTFDIPQVLLAGVAYNEVGGMMDWMDDLAYGGRKTVPFTKDPKLTSIAPMSLQVRRAGEELGYDPATMTKAQMNAVVESLQDPQQAIFLAAKHLARLRDIDYKGKGAASLTVDEIIVIGTRYNQGPDKSLSEIMLNKDYGIAIMKRGKHILKLLKD